MSTSSSRDESAIELDPVDGGPGPEQRAAREEEISALRAALGGLPARDRLLLRMRYEQELTLEEIARLTGLSGGSTVHRALRRAVEKMRSRMGLQDEQPTSVRDE